MYEGQVMNLLRETMRLHLLEKGARPTAIYAYLSRCDGALETDGAAPLPCPDCYVRGEVARLQRIPSPAGVGIVRCPSCRAEFEFPDFQPVATTEGIWPTSA
jgi:hypothetical protein